jgi:hypothetical protein
MKYEENIELLLNGFVDGQLTSREITELKRLMRNDPELQKRLTELQKCRNLVGGLPVEKAPADLVEKVMVSAGLQAQPQQAEQKPKAAVKSAAFGLMLRKLVSAAAIVLLTLGLLALVWIVLSPEKKANKQTTVAKAVKASEVNPRSLDKAQDKSREIVKEQPVAKTTSPESKKAEIAKPSVEVKKSEIAAAKTVTEKIAPSGPPFSATLQLTTKKLLAADISLKKVLEESARSEFSLLSSGDNKYIYALDCNTAKLNSFLMAAEGIWEQFSGSKLIIDTGQAEKPFVIDMVKSWQIGDLASLSDPERRLKAAQYYAILNNSQKLLQQNETVAQDQEDILQLLDKPKPVLTKDEKPIEKQPGGPQKMHLTIEISADQQ